MKPVDQRLWKVPSTPLMGDCLAACVASIFELELQEVPHFVDLQYRLAHRVPKSDDWWFPMLNLWASDFGIGANYLRYAPRRKPKNWHPGYWIAGVQSRVTDDGRHAVVMWGPEVKHDPNPESRAATKPYRFISEMWFELFDPAVWLEQLDWRVILNLTRIVA